MMDYECTGIPNPRQCTWYSSITPEVKYIYVLEDFRTLQAVYFPSKHSRATLGTNSVAMVT